MDEGLKRREGMSGSAVYFEFFDKGFEKGKEEGVDKKQNGEVNC